MQTEAHVRLIADLRRPKNHTWVQMALLACLERLSEGGATEGAIVLVRDAWSGPGPRLNVIYQPPWMPFDVGCVRWRGSRDLNRVYGAEHGGPMTAMEFGWNVADWDIGEPLGTYAD